MAKTKYFKTESKKLLDLMINAIYTHKDIFLRELISNASDAIDKRHHLSLVDETIQGAEDYSIDLSVDEEARTLSIEDNGIGMREEELIHNLGTIAESGSKAFLEKVEKQDVDMIGQFGVGFYSAFMVADMVEIETRSAYESSGYRWRSKGSATYQIEPIERDTIGTKITVHLREDNSDEELDFSRYLKTTTLQSLVKQYSDYIRYPITLPIEKEEDGEKHVERETLNSMIPLWKKPKSALTDEAVETFYKRQFNAFDAPLHTIHTSVEGKLTYTALLFIPQKPAHDFYTENYEKGLQLYSKGVFIEDKNKALIPDHFRFVRGLVDSADLTLNISREMLQHDRQLKAIARHIEKKIRNELEKLLANDRDTYITFYDTYKTTLKYGVYDQFGANKDSLKDLLMFKTAQNDDYITLKEYMDQKSESQEAIYYVTGKSKAEILARPQLGAFKDKNIDVLLFTDDIDEFMVQVIADYDGVPFKSVQQAENDFIDEDAKEALKEKSTTHKELLDAIKESLGEKVSTVTLSGRLKDAPVCIVSGEGISMEMEKVLRNLPNQPELKADKILEINPDHPIFGALETVHKANPDKIDDYANVLYHQALLLEGYPIDDPAEFSRLMTDLMLEASKK